MPKATFMRLKTGSNKPVFQLKLIKRSWTWDNRTKNFMLKSTDFPSSTNSKSTSLRQRLLPLMFNSQLTRLKPILTSPEFQSLKDKLHQHHSQPISSKSSKRNGLLNIWESLSYLKKSTDWTKSVQILTEKELRSSGTWSVLRTTFKNWKWNTASLRRQEPNSQPWPPTLELKVRPAWFRNLTCK